MKNLERLVTYLAMTGVFFAALYALFPGFTDRLITTYGPYFGPVIVAGILVLVFLKRKKTT